MMLSVGEGRVEKSGELLCSYHAWTFNGEGRCTHIPQASGESAENLQKRNDRSCAKSFPVQIEQGLIWVWGDSGLPGSDVHIEAALKRPRLIEELQDPQYKDRIAPIKWNFRDLPYGWDMFMEVCIDFFIT